MQSVNLFYRTRRKYQSVVYHTKIFIYVALLLLLSHFSRVRLCATLQMTAHQAPCPWDSPGKNTGVGYHFLLQCMRVKSESEVAQLCPTLRDPMDCSLPGSVHRIFQARVPEWGAIAFSIQILGTPNKMKSLSALPCSMASFFTIDKIQKKIYVQHTHILYTH